ncbi:MAG: adenylate kinase family enzyme [Psychromonas sp.]|jgi:adenylate kinase family enzyme|uniref:hypothetical protein n=1 Tax=Psychromonas sp. TaxID=1884585 RepID=UPI0039E49073
MIVLLNGSINSGKTTVAESIVERSINFAHIEVDALRDFVRWMPLEETIELNIKNAIAVAKNFHENDINSVISYPLSEDNFNYINELLLDSSIEVHAVALYPGIDKLRTNRGMRELTEWEVRRVDELHEMGLSRPCFGTVIDNSEQTIEETTDSVLQIVGMKKT